MPFGIAAGAAATALGASAGTAALVGAGGALAGKVATGLIGGGKQSSQAAAGASQAQANLEPFITPGVNALTQSSDLLGLNGPDAATAAMAKFHTDPGYQFQLDQGLRAVDAGAASKGLLHSGATIKGEQTFGTGLADQSFSNYYNRLYGLATLGETAGAGGAALAQSAGNTQANITGNVAGGVSNSVDSLFANPKVASGINSLFSSKAAASGPDPFADPFAGNTLR